MEFSSHNRKEKMLSENLCVNFSKKLLGFFYMYVNYGERFPYANSAKSILSFAKSIDVIQETDSKYLVSSNENNNDTKSSIQLVYIMETTHSP